MTTESKRWTAIGGIVVVIAGAGAYMARATLFGAQDQADKILAEIESKPLEQRFEQMRGLREKAEQLSEDQREKIHDGMRAMFEKEIDARAAEYENAPEDEKGAVLDKHIDEWVAMRERMRSEWEARRAEREQERKQRAAEGGDAGEGDGSTGGNEARGGDRERGPGRGFGRAAPTREERKQRLESRDPDADARRFRYFGAVMKRARERGIEMRGPGGPGGRGGGPGRGGPGRGPRGGGPGA